MLSYYLNEANGSLYQCLVENLVDTNLGRILKGVCYKNELI